ncbi:MAG: hypothetical protein ACFFDN_00455 [Candidatus Hodarchaeota archaeon]
MDEEITDIKLTITGEQGFESIAFKISFKDNSYVLYPISVKDLQDFRLSCNMIIKDFENKTKVFIINKYLTLKLKNNNTDIYVKGKYFNHCKYLLLNLDPDKFEDYDTIKSIDDASETLDNSHEYDKRLIDPRETFQGHCSNLQVWAENEYDTRLLHRNLAFSLLKQLTEVGDPIAKKRFKEEIALRLEAGEINVFIFFLEQGYLSNLTKDELLGVLENTQNPIMKLFIRSFLNNPTSIDFSSLSYELSQEYIREINSLFLHKENILMCPFDINESSLKNVRGRSFYNEYYPDKSIYEKIKYKLVYADKFLDFDIPSNTNWKIVYSLNYIKKVRGILGHNPDMTISIPKTKGPLRISSQEEGLKIYIQPEIFY